MTDLLVYTDDLLRGRQRASRRGPALVRIGGLLLLCGMSYGAVMGSFGGLSGDRPLQIVYSAVKVPLLLLATCALSLPSFFVLNSLLGLRADFPPALRALVTAQAGLTIILASLAPFTMLWYASSAHYPTAILFNGLMFAVATFGAQGPLRREYRPLIARNPRHRRLLGIWLVTYTFVGIQMAWLLRPFVGAPNKPVQFFREGAWDNAYVIVARMLWDVLAS